MHINFFPYIWYNLSCFEDIRKRKKYFDYFKVHCPSPFVRAFDKNKITNCRSVHCVFFRIRLNSYIITSRFTWYLIFVKISNKCTHWNHCNILKQASLAAEGGSLEGLDFMGTPPPKVYQRWILPKKSPNVFLRL